jgi:hypothetical protein
MLAQVPQEIAERGTFAATFFLACLAALEMEGLRLEELLSENDTYGERQPAL